MATKSYKDYLFVGTQILLLSVYIVPVGLATLHFDTVITQAGLVLTIAGFLIVIVALIQLNKNLSPFPTPKDGSQLIKTGLYRFIRHPIYTSLFITVLGYGLYKESLWKILVAVVLLLLFYYKSKYEEDLLQKRYADYKDYKKETARFLPFILLLISL